MISLLSDRFPYLLIGIKVAKSGSIISRSCYCRLPAQTGNYCQLFKIQHFFSIKKAPCRAIMLHRAFDESRTSAYNWKRYRTMQRGGPDETLYSESGRMSGRNRRMDHPEYPLLVHRNQTARRKRHLRYHFILRFQLGVSFLQRYSRALHHTGMIAGDFLSHGDRDVNTTSYNSFLEALSKFLRGTAIRGIRCVYLYVG